MSSIYEQQLFELIRKEEIVLWAGAGMSIPFGFPSGKLLTEQLYASLLPAEREVVAENLSLLDLTEEIVRLKNGNRQPLIKKIQQIFNDADSGTNCATHDLISRIPHINTIITTNYDQLFERSYGNRCQTVITVEQTQFLERDKVHVYKIHGDILHPNSILLTSSDYRNFFKQSENAIWSTVRGKIISNSILFIGYNNEDAHVQNMVETVREEMGNSFRPSFLIAPNLQEHKIKYLERNGISYINTTGDDFFKRLNANIRENNVADLYSKKVSVDTFTNYCRYNNAYPDLTAVGDKTIVTSIKQADGSVNGSFKFSVQVPNDSELVEKIQNLRSGFDSDKLVIPGTNVTQANLELSGFPIPVDNEGTGKIILEPIPGYEGNFDITFEDGSEFRDFSLKIFGGTEYKKIVVNLKGPVLSILLPLPLGPLGQFRILLDPPNKLARLVDGIEAYDALAKFFMGKTFTAYGKEREIKNAGKSDEQTVEMCQHFVSILRKLKEIEAFFKVRFSDFDFKQLLSQQNEIAELSNIIESNTILEEFREGIAICEIDTNHATFQSITNMEECEIRITSDSPIEISILGQKINLGYKTRLISDAYLTNLEYYDTNYAKAIIKSKSNKSIITYQESRELIK